MKNFVLIAHLLLVGISGAFSQADTGVKPLDPVEEHLIELSREKWQWMADKNADKLATLFHDRSKFVHMSGTWKKDEELEIIRSGSIWYKKVDVHDVAAEITNNTAVLWSRITLAAVVRGNDALNEFTVTEVFVKRSKEWKLLALTFSSVRDTHVIKH